MAWIVTRREPCSRDTCAGPSSRLTLASEPSGTRAPEGVGTRIPWSAATLAARRGGVPDDDVERPLALVDHARLRPADGRRDEFVDLLDRHADAGERGAVGPDDELREARRLLGRHVGPALGLREDRRDLGGGRVEDVVVLAVHLHGHVAADARDELVRPHLDGLEELHARAGHVFERLGHRLDELLLRPHVAVDLGPLAAVLEDHVRVGDLDAHRVRRDLGAARARHHRDDLGERLDAALDLGRDLERLGERDARQADDLDREVALVEARQELAAEPREHEQRDARAAATVVPTTSLPEPSARVRTGR